MTDTDLIEEATRKAGAQTRLADVIGISHEGLSRAKGKNHLGPIYRDQILAYLRGDPVKALKRTRGRPPNFGGAVRVEYIDVSLTPAEMDRFEAVAAAHASGNKGVLSDALASATKTFRGILDSGATIPIPAVVSKRCRVDADVLSAFHAVLGDLVALRSRFVRRALVLHLGLSRTWEQARQGRGTVGVAA